MDVDARFVDLSHAFWASPGLVQAVRDDQPGTVIRLIRQAAGLTQGQLGQRCGYSTSTISRIERGRPPVNQVAVRRHIAGVLGIPGEYLGLSLSVRRHDAPSPAFTSATPAAAAADSLERLLLAGGLWLYRCPPSVPRPSL